jgi:hypothetical protein
MTRSMLRSLAAAVSAAFVVGCGSDPPSGPSTSRHTLDLAAVMAQMSIGRPTSIPGASVVMSVPASTGVPVILPSACPFSSTAQGFTCPTVTSGGLTFDISYFLYDAAGKAQSQLDANTTASVRTLVDTKGTTSVSPSNGTSGTASIADHSDMTMSGLLTSAHALNGNGTSHYDLTLSGTTSIRAVIDMTTATKNVTIPTPTDADIPAWPTSGTITTDGKTVATIGGLGSISTTSHTVITFNGMSTATIVLTTSGAATTCTLDLAGKNPPVCSGS